MHALIWHEQNPYLYRVPGFEEKMALQLWIFGLRQPFPFEVAKAAPETLAKAESLVARMEDAFSGKADSDQQSKKNKQRKICGNYLAQNWEDNPGLKIKDRALLVTSKPTKNIHKIVIAGMGKLDNLVPLY